MHDVHVGGSSKPYVPVDITAGSHRGKQQCCRESGPSLRRLLRGQVAAAAAAVRLKKLLSAERAPGALSPSSSGGQLRPNAAHASRMSAGSGAWILSGSPVAGCLTCRTRP